MLSRSLIALAIVAFSLPGSRAVLLGWEASLDPEAAGYRLYYSEGSSPDVIIDVGNQLQHSVDDLTPGRTYEFYVTAYDDSGVESIPSNALTYTVPSSGSGPSAPVLHPPAYYSPTQVLVTWDPNPEPDISRYRLYYGEVNGSTNSGWVADSYRVQGLVAGRTYFFFLTAWNTSNDESAPSQRHTYTVPGGSSPPPEPPSAPVLHTPQYSGTTASLNWAPNPEPDLAGYHLYYGELNTPASVVPVDNVTSHQVTGLAHGRTYFFYLTARDISGLESAPSQQYTYAVPQPSPTPPTAPVLHTPQFSGTTAALNWTTNPEPDLAGYRVYYGELNTPATVLSMGNVTSHQLTDLSPGVTYFFHLTALNTAGLESAPSQQYTYAVPQSPPDPGHSGPSAPRLHPPCFYSPSQVMLTWDPNPEPDITRYRLYLGEVNGSTNSGWVTTSYRAQGLVAGRTYFFFLTAWNSSGEESLPSQRHTYTVPANGTVTFLGADSQTSGSWSSNYGADGSLIAGHGQSLPPWGGIL